jgi:hypothetical protein
MRTGHIAEMTSEVELQQPQYRQVLDSRFRVNDAYLGLVDFCNGLHVAGRVLLR